MKFFNYDLFEKQLNGGEEMSIDVREPVVKGTFYPGNKNNLSKMIGDFIIDANPVVKKDKEILGLIVPHAGYIYSGPCAAYAYKLLKYRKFDTVIVLGPSHSTMLKGASVWKQGLYKTPLGDVKIDENASDYLLKNGPDIEFHQIAHMQEQSVEVQVPFLQYVLKDEFMLVPVVIGNQTSEYSKQLASTLYDLMQEKTGNYLVVASSDLSHYHTDDVAKRMDREVINLIKNKNIAQLAKTIDSGRGEACGIGSILTLLFLADKYDTNLIDILNVTNSGDVSGDRSRVVGYMSAAVYK